MKPDSHGHQSDPVNWSPALERAVGPVSARMSLRRARRRMYGRHLERESLNEVCPATAVRDDDDGVAGHAGEPGDRCDDDRHPSSASFANSDRVAGVRAGRIRLPRCIAPAASEREWRRGRIPDFQSPRVDIYSCPRSRVSPQPSPRALRRVPCATTAPKQRSIRSSRSVLLFRAPDASGPGVAIGPRAPVRR